MVVDDVVRSATKREGIFIKIPLEWITLLKTFIMRCDGWWMKLMMIMMAMMRMMIALKTGKHTVV